MGILAIGTRSESFSQEKTHEDGSHKAGVGQITKFVFEELTMKNYSFWFQYGGAMNAICGGAKHGKELKIAIKGFLNAMDNHSAFPNMGVGLKMYIAYSTLDINTIKTNNPAKSENIQMSMTVSTASKPFFAVTHMGIFRSPLLSINAEKYEGKTSRGIAVALHCFAAKSLAGIRPNYKAKLMITAPMPQMGSLLGKVIPVESVRGLEPKSNQLVTYKLSKKGFMNIVSIKSKHYKIEQTLAMTDCPWLLNLAFNPQHVYKAAFTDFAALSN